MKDCVKSPSDILHEDERAGVVPITVDTQRHVPLKTADELGDELFRVLVRTVDVVSTGDDEGKLEGSEIRLGDELSSSLGSGIWVGGLENHVFAVVLSLTFTIDFVSTDMNEPLHTTTISSFQENVGTQDVGLGERKGVPEGVVDMGLSRKVHHSVNFLRHDDVANEINGTDVPLHELVVGVLFQLSDVLCAGAVVQTIKVDNIIVRVVLHQPTNNMRPDKTGSTGDKNALGGVGIVGHDSKELWTKRQRRNDEKKNFWGFFGFGEPSVEVSLTSRKKKISQARFPVPVIVSGSGSADEQREKRKRKR